MLKALPQQLEFVPHGAIVALETEQKLAQYTESEARVQSSLEVLADKLEAEVGVRLHPDRAPPPIVPEKRTEVYEEPFSSADAQGAGPVGTSTPVAKSSVAANARGSVAAVSSSSDIVDGKGKGKSRKRQRDSATDQSAGTAVAAEGRPERNTKSQKHKRVRKD